jgi:hypothetical protein
MSPSDPWTSHAAADSIEEDTLSRHRRVILTALERGYAVWRTQPAKQRQARPDGIAGSGREGGEMDAIAVLYPKEIAEAIAKVMGGDLYVQKRGTNTFQNYKYATVGDLLDKLQPLMAEAGLVIFQDEVDSNLVENGSIMIIRYQFTLAHTSGAVWPEKPVHRGMSAFRTSKGGLDDKAANKCHTAARKYFLLGLFQVPTGEDYREPLHDGDADKQGEVQQPPPRPLPPSGPIRTAAPPPQLPRRSDSKPAPEERPAVTAARQRIKMLIDQLQHSITSAPNAHVLGNVMQDRAGDLAEIEKAGQTGVEAARILRVRYEARMKDLEDAR